MITATAATSPPDEHDYTWLERRLYAALTALGIDYRPQHEIGWYRLDAYLPRAHLAIEADGCSWHGCLECGWDRPFDREMRARDRRRDARLLLVHSIATVRVAGHNMDHDEQALTSVRTALIAAGVLPPAAERSESA